MNPGIYSMPMSEYLADPCPEPSLSAGLAHTLVTRSPAHAWCEHPRLNLGQSTRSASSAEQDEGSALHALLLEGEDIMVPCDFADWRTKAAQEARNAAREAGKIPLLADRYDELREAADRIAAQIAAHADAADAFTRGRPEQTMLWQQQGIWCRARVDWLDDDPGGWLTDLKTVTQGAEPGLWGKNLATNGYALGAHHYLTGARALGRDPRGYRWIVAERNPPYAVSVVTMAPSLADLARRQWEEAMRIWRECLARDVWPSYPPHTAWIEAPAWAAMQWEERELRRPPAVDAMVLQEGFA